MPALLLRHLVATTKTLVIIACFISVSIIQPAVAHSRTFDLKSKRTFLHCGQYALVFFCTKSAWSSPDLILILALPLCLPF